MTIEEKLPRREREKIFRKNEIIEAATKLFAEKGYDYTTLDDIAEKAEFGKGTIYNYFRSKEDIFNLIIEGIFEGHYRILSEAVKNTSTFKDLVSIITKDIFMFCLTNQDQFKLLVQVRTNNLKLGFKKCSEKCAYYDKKIFAMYKKVLLESIKKGEIVEMDTESLIIFYPSFVFPYIVSLIAFKGEENIDSEKEISFLNNIIFNGILKK